MVSNEIEELTIRAFLQRPRQDRALTLLSQPKRRKSITSELSHFKWIDERFVHSVDPKWNSVAGIVGYLQQMGASSVVYVISEAAEIDGTEMPLKEAIEYIWGRGIGTILSCVPGKLAYIEDEDGSRILKR